MKDSNLILLTDGYKLSHYKQYPEGTTKIYSYLESRGGKFDSTIFFGLQYYIENFLIGKVITAEKINEAHAFSKKYFGKDIFNLEGWNYILGKYDGKLPVTIKAVREGTLVPTGNVLLTIENNDPDCFWLTNFLETLILKIWYTVTISSNSFYCKRIIKKYMEETQGNSNGLEFKLVDFGARGVSSCEQAELGGMSHLVNFCVSDTLEGVLCAMRTYNADVCGFSIPASEHSTITSWGRENESKAIANMLEKYPTGLVACVMDSFDVYNAAENICGTELHDKIMQRDGTLVFRPDSGHPPEVLSRLLDIMWNKFGGDYTTKGYKILNPKVRIIQGDGIDHDMIEEILLMMKNKGFAADNIVFGSGGGLLQKFDRDTQKFAIKCSHAIINDKEVYVYKDPITSKGKASKKGLLKLHKMGTAFMTISSADETPHAFNAYADSLETVFENGELIRKQSFDEIREIANSYL